MIINAIKVKNLTFWVNFDEFQELRASFIDFCSRKHQDLLKESKKIHENLPKIENFFKILMIKTAIINFQKLKILKYAQNRP